MATIKRNKKLQTSFMQGGAYIVGREVARFVCRQQWHELFNSGWEDYNVGLHSLLMKSRGMKRLSWNCKNNKKTVIYHKCPTSPTRCMD